LTVTLGAFSNTNNATLGIFGTDSDQSYTAGSGFSSVVHVSKLFVEFQASNIQALRLAGHTALMQP